MSLQGISGKELDMVPHTSNPGRLKQKPHEFKTNLGYTTSHGVKKKKSIQKMSLKSFAHSCLRDVCLTKTYKGDRDDPVSHLFWTWVNRFILRGKELQTVKA